MALGAAGLLYAPDMVGTFVAATAILVAVPVGFIRASTRWLDALAVPSVGEAVSRSVASAPSSLSTSPSSTSSVSLNDRIKELVEGGSLLGDIAAGAGLRGGATRLVLGMFMPATDKMVEEIVNGATNTAAGSSGGGGGGGGGGVGGTGGGAADAALLAGNAANGLVAGHLQNWRDTATMIGAGVGAGLVLLIVGADTIFGRLARKAERVAEAVEDARDKVDERVQEKREKFDEARDAWSDRMERKREELGDMVEQSKGRLEDRKRRVAEAAEAAKETADEQVQAGRDFKDSVGDSLGSAADALLGRGKGFGKK